METPNLIQLKTRKEIIDETVAFYNSSNRAVAGAICVMRDNEGRKCAVGRCLNDLYFIEHPEVATGLTSLFNAFLKPEYIGHPDAFWVELQGLHDADNFWDGNGITEAGKAYAKSLHSHYDEDGPV